MKREFFRRVLAAGVAIGALALAPWAHAEDEAPDAMIKRLSTDVLDNINPVNRRVNKKGK
jgi:phospholipid transport system substrate-binding protein